MGSILLENKVRSYIPTMDSRLVERQIKIQNMSFSNLRDCIIGLGKILEEDIEINVYVVNIPAGIANKNDAVVGIQLNAGCITMLGYAKEGLFNQHTTEKAMEKVLSRVSRYCTK